LRLWDDAESDEA